MALVDLVDPLFAVNEPGNCLPGPYRPFGLVRVGPDVAYPQTTHGYRSGAPVVRISHTHVAGTGGCSRYGNIGLSPFAGEPRKNRMAPFLSPPLLRNSDAIPSHESARVGLYRATLEPYGIGYETTVSARVGLHRLRYPEGSQSWVLVDAASVIQTGLGVPGELRNVEEWDSEGACTGSEIEVVSERELSGAAGWHLLRVRGQSAGEHRARGVRQELR
jgi:putative alpha-1,2-mannosidase